MRDIIVSTTIVGETQLTTGHPSVNLHARSSKALTVANEISAQLMPNFGRAVRKSLAHCIRPYISVTSEHPDWKGTELETQVSSVGSKLCVLRQTPGPLWA